MQCEVLQGQLLGGLPQDEDPVPGPDDFPLGSPFDMFGFGQNGPGPAAQPNQQGGPNEFLASLCGGSWDRISSLLMLSGKDCQIMFRRSPILISMRMLRTHQSLI